ncbi:hypothetical protein LAZ67_6003862 [Cordylochernes scorpioides]|uniref:Uncharacterized protein n=1 Tax=Cordylochernes scorpioides TaxID=51811 RepID=A0ABY6KNV2_9ARAC|nr:hypothetical protein LAZ67_6003862 [Cordylochernes scorpioides]
MEAPLKDCTKLEQRAVIRFLNAEDIQTSQICQRMKNIYADNLNKSYGTVHTIINEQLQFRKICCRWIPHFLNLDQNLTVFGFKGSVKAKELKGKRFDSDEDVQKVVQDFFHTLPKSAYKEGIYKLPERFRQFDLPDRFFRALKLYWIILILYDTLEGDILEMESRQLRFWFKPNLPDSEQMRCTQNFFKDLVTPSEFPRDYVGFIKKIMKLMQQRYPSIKRVEVELQQLGEDPSTRPNCKSHPLDLSPLFH